MRNESYCNGNTDHGNAIGTIQMCQNIHRINCIVVCTYQSSSENKNSNFSLTHYTHSNFRIMSETDDKDNLNESNLPKDDAGNSTMESLQPIATPATPKSEGKGSSDSKVTKGKYMTHRNIRGSNARQLINLFC